MPYEAEGARAFASAAMEYEVNGAAFFFSVIHKSKVRIRTQTAYALNDTDINFTPSAFSRVKSGLW